MLRLPPPEDANAIQVGLMRIQKAVIEDTISMKKAGLLLYSMQLALTNVGQTTFGQAKDEEMVRETVDEEEALSRQRSASAKNKTNTKELLPQRTQRTRKEKRLPRMDADDRGLRIGTSGMEAYTGYVQDGHAGRERGLRGQLSDEDQAESGRRAKAVEGPAQPRACQVP